MPEIQQALCKKGYILVIIGGRITNCQRRLKSRYRDLEMKLILSQLEKNPTKIPSLSQKEMMCLLLASWEKL